MSRIDGGPAFPIICDDPNVPYEAGMSLRDYFAGQVISQCHIVYDAAAAPPDAELTKLIAERFARRAYQIADAMLAERQK